MEKAILDKAIENLQRAGCEVHLYEPGRINDAEWLLPDGTEVTGLDGNHHIVALQAGFHNDADIETDTEESQGYINALLAEGWIRLRGRQWEVWELNSKTIKLLERRLDVVDRSEIYVYVYTEKTNYRIDVDQYRDRFSLRKVMVVDRHFSCTYGHHIAELADLLNPVFPELPKDFSRRKLESAIDDWEVERVEGDCYYGWQVSKDRLVLIRSYYGGDYTVWTAPYAPELWKRAQERYDGYDKTDSVKKRLGNFFYALSGTMSAWENDRWED